jgi:uncharacterized protein
MSPAASQHVQSGARAVDALAAEWERTYAMWIHLAGLIGGIAAALSAGVSLPMALLAVLILWLIKRDQSPFVDDHGREAVNFQISLIIYAMVLFPIAVVLTCGLGFVLIIPIAILAIVGTWTASLAAKRGEYFRYPATIRLLR